jgi:hypothetical protein
MIYYFVIVKYPNGNGNLKTEYKSLFYRAKPVYPLLRDQNGQVYKAQIQLEDSEMSDKIREQDELDDPSSPWNHPVMWRNMRDIRIGIEALARGEDYNGKQAEWAKCFFYAGRADLTKRLDEVEKTLRGFDNVYGKAEQAAREQVNFIMTGDSFIKSITQTLTRIPDAIRLIVARLLKSPAGMTTIGQAVFNQEREFQVWTETIRNILGPLAEGHEAEIVACAWQAITEELSLDHAVELIEREQGNGNLPKKAEEEEKPPKEPKPRQPRAPRKPKDKTVPNNAEKIVTQLKGLIKPEQFVVNEPAIKVIAKNFARRKPENRLLSMLVQIVMEKLGDIFAE